LHVIDIFYNEIGLFCNVSAQVGQRYNNQYYFKVDAWWAQVNFRITLI